MNKLFNMWSDASRAAAAEARRIHAKLAFKHSETATDASRYTENANPKDAIGAHEYAADSHARAAQTHRMVRDSYKANQMGFSTHSNAVEAHDAAAKFHKEKADALSYVEKLKS